MSACHASGDRRAGKKVSLKADAIPLLVFALCLAREWERDQDADKRREKKERVAMDSCDVLALVNQHSSPCGALDVIGEHTSIKMGVMYLE